MLQLQRRFHRGARTNRVASLPHDGQTYEILLRPEERTGLGSDGCMRSPHLTQRIIGHRSGTSSAASFSASWVQILAISRQVRRNSSGGALWAQREHSRAKDLYSSATGMMSATRSILFLNVQTSAAKGFWRTSSTCCARGG